MITSEMESHGGRGVATIDITGAYLYTDNNDYLNMLIKGGLEELMAMVDPDIYQKYVKTGEMGKL